jgi:hypothetical protein
MRVRKGKPKICFGIGGAVVADVSLDEGLYEFVDVG